MIADPAVGMAGVSLVVVLPLLGEFDDVLTTLFASMSGCIELASLFALAFLRGEWDRPLSRGRFMFAFFFLFDSDIKMVGLAGLR